MAPSKRIPLILPEDGRLHLVAFVSDRPAKDLRRWTGLAQTAVEQQRNPVADDSGCALVAGG